MISRRRTLFILPLLAWALVSPANQAGAAADDVHTRVELVADVSSVRPGMTFTVGVVLKMDPGWHTYWVNSGESGLATSISWTLPAGVRAGRIGWPLPEKTVESGDILTYGYGGETMLMVPIELPEALPAGSTLHLKAHVEWLECKTTCLPGAADVELALPVTPSAPSAANEALFSRYRARIPAPYSPASGFSWGHRSRGERLTIFLLPSGPVPADLQRLRSADFFAEPVDGYATGRTSIESRGDSVFLTLPVTPLGDPRPGVLRGVLVFPETGGVHRGSSIEIPLGGAGGSFRTSGSILDREFAGGRTAGESQSLLIYLLLAVAGGLLLNIMPCVLPVIALKIFGLVKMAGEAHGRVRRLGWFFSLGILASFLLLALTVILLKLGGEQIGWGFQFQEPLFVIAMSAVVFVFGLSLFGVMEIRVPGAAVSGLGGVVASNEGGKGYAASFWEGVFATVLATPCTAPFLGTALGFAFAQPWWTVLLIFAAAAFGMSLPYLILTARPAWMKYLPKPGAWMESAKQFMGFLMMATLLWLLYILGKQLGMEGVIWTGAFLLTVAVGTWIIGRFATLTASRRRVLATWAIALAVAIGGYFFFLEGILDVRNVLAGTPPPSSGGAGTGGIEWKPFSISGLDAELRDGRGVFLDFTAEWCLTCKVNEKTVLNDNDVIDAVRRSGIVTMKADWTNRNPEITRLLRKFGRSGVPLYVLFPAGRPDEPIVLPEVITPSLVIEAIQKAAPVQ